MNNKPFSTRIGLYTPRSVFQVESMDDKLKTKLWDVIHVYFYKVIWYMHPQDREQISKFLWCDILEKSIIDIPTIYDDNTPDLFEIWNIITRLKMSYSWNENYDFIESIMQIDFDNRQDFNSAIEKVLREELAGYTLIENSIIPITNEIEVKEIEISLKNTTRIETVHNHIQTALAHLGNRQNPDYRNSIKEAISAVESMVSFINGSNGTLGKGIQKLSKSYEIHESLIKSVETLYGYASDFAGIRHGHKENVISINPAEAKFILIWCCSLVNYLHSLYSTEIHE